MNQGAEPDLSESHSAERVQQIEAENGQVERESGVEIRLGRKERFGSSWTAGRPREQAFWLPREGALIGGRARVFRHDAVDAGW